MQQEKDPKDVNEAPEEDAPKPVVEEPSEDAPEPDSAPVQQDHA